MVIAIELRNNVGDERMAIVQSPICQASSLAQIATYTQHIPVTTGFRGEMPSAGGKARDVGARGHADRYVWYPLSRGRSWLDPAQSWWASERAPPPSLVVVHRYVRRAITMIQAHNTRSIVRNLRSMGDDNADDFPGWARWDGSLHTLPYLTLPYLSPTWLGPNVPKEVKRRF